MVNQFDIFFRDKNYLMIKNSSFNYLNRKYHIKQSYKKYIKEKNPKILDIGSGISPVSPDMKNTKFADISLDAVKFLKDKGFNSECEDITKLREKAESYDIILCSEVLEHVKDYKKGLKEIRRVLKKDGIAIITVPVYKKYWDIDDEFVKHVQRFEPEEFRESLKKIGFKIVEEKPIGSWIEKQLTLFIVKTFKKNSNKRIGYFKSRMIILCNWIFYFLVRISILTSNKNRTSIMLYVVDSK